MLVTFFLVIDRIYDLTDLVITKGVPFDLVAQLFVFILPSFLAHTLPMALMVAVLLAGGFPLAIHSHHGGRSIALGRQPGDPGVTVTDRDQFHLFD